MLQWGIDKADELGLDCFVESTLDGRLAYESVGFQVIGELYLDATTDNPDESFKAAKEDEKVREAWNLGCERHLEAVSLFDGHRERVRNLVATGTLAEA